MSADDNKPWGWWGGSNDEHYSGGPFDAREEAVEYVRESYEEGYVVEAYISDIDLSKQFCADSWLERVDEHLFEECSGENGPDSFIEDITDDQVKDLQKVVREAVAMWQAQNQIVITPYLFTGSRNEEFIKAKDQDQ